MSNIQKEWFACQNIFPIEMVKPLTKGELNLNFCLKWIPTGINDEKTQGMAQKNNASFTTGKLDIPIKSNFHYWFLHIISLFFTSILLKFHFWKAQLKILMISILYYIINSHSCERQWNNLEYSFLYYLNHNKPKWSFLNVM